MLVKYAVTQIKEFRKKYRYRNRIVKLLSGAGKLTLEEKRAAIGFYAPYIKISTVFHEFYKQTTGDFQCEYIPSDFYFLKIDKYFNHAQKAVVLENKCYFHRMFEGGEQPGLVCYRLNGFWYSPNDKMISSSIVSDLLSRENEVVIKQAIGSSGGRAVFFIGKNTVHGISEDFWNQIKQIKQDIVVQRTVRQHLLLAQINQSSVNTIRILSMLGQNGVKIYSSVLRVGRNGSRVDNSHSGGIHCGIKEDGGLKKAAHNDQGEIFFQHPDSQVVFENFQVPNYQKVVEAVQELHPLIPHFRLVSWDMSVEEDGTPVLIEANLNYGDCLLHQMENGPLFGADTKRILDEVFHND